jgi:hypothetical protein
MYENVDGRSKTNVQNFLLVVVLNVLNYKGDKMRVKVNGKWYDGETDMIMVELSAWDRKNIQDMPKSNKKYANFPDGTPLDQAVADFMEVPLKLLLGQPKSKGKKQK